jgi:hypothetical protein
MRKLTVVSLSCLGLVLAATAAAADVYRWVDDKGVVHYGDKPQHPGDQPVALPQLQTYKSGTAPPGFDNSADASSSANPKVPAAATSIAITAPEADETIRDADGKVQVNVSGQPGHGQGLVYYLDGTAQNEAPTSATSYLMSGVERGDHNIAVALVGTDGQELSRSAAVTIHMMPPRAKH